VTAARTETVGQDGAVRSSGPAQAFKFTPRLVTVPEGDWYTIIREHGIGDLLFTIPFAAELKRRGHLVCYRCPMERYMLVRHVADLWQAVQSPESAKGVVIDLRSVADDGQPMDDVNRPEAYCRHANITPRTLRFSFYPTAAHIRAGMAIRDNLKADRIALLAPLAAHPARNLPDAEEIAGALAADGWTVLLSQTGRHPLQRLRDGADRKTVLDDLIASVLAADVVVSADSGPLYVASALGKPCVGIFRTVDPLLRLKYQAGWVAFAPRASYTGQQIAGAALFAYHHAESAEVVRGESQ
jgi:hypothetical protein